MPGKKTREKLRKARDSGSSGNDRDRSSGSRKSGDKMVRKPSKELLKIQNVSDSTDEEDLKPTRKTNSRRNGSHYSELKSSQDHPDSQETGNDDQCGLSSTSKEQSPRNRIKKSPSLGQKSPRPKKPKRSPERSQNSNASSTTCKSLNSQIKDYVKSPSKSPRPLSTFDAFNHTSSLKLSHLHSSQDKPKHDNQGKYDSYYDYYHPRRSSREVLDFTSNRKSTKDLTKIEDDASVVVKRNAFKREGRSKEDKDMGDSSNRKMLI